MPITSFIFDHFLLNEFIEFGYNVYSNDSYWIPPLRKEIRYQLSPTFIFHRNPLNKHVNFILKSYNKSCGRISAMINSDLRDQDQTPVGIIGFFDCINDYYIAEELFNYAINWLHCENGISRIWGPMNYDIWHGYRLMTRGFDHLPFYGEPYNHPYYPDFFERYGFFTKQQWASYAIPGRVAINKCMERCRDTYLQISQEGYRFENISMRRFLADMKILYTVMIPSFGGFLGNTEIHIDEFVRMFISAKHVFRQRLFRLVYDKENTLVGFGCAFPDISKAMRSLEGKRSFSGIMSFYRYRRYADSVIYYIMGVTPLEGSKRKGLGRAIVYDILDATVELGYDRFIAALIAERNPTRAFVHGLYTEIPHEYTLYELNT